MEYAISYVEDVNHLSLLYIYSYMCSHTIVNTQKEKENERKMRRTARHKNSCAC